MPRFEHPLQLFSLEHPEGWEARYQEETGGVVLVHPGLGDACALSLTPLAVTGAEPDLSGQLVEIGRRVGVPLDPAEVVLETRGDTRLAYGEGVRSGAGDLGGRMRFWVVRHEALTLHVAQLGPGAEQRPQREAADAALLSLTFPELLPPTPHEFQQRVLDVVEREYDRMEARPRGEWAVDLVDTEGRVVGSVGLENLYRSCLLNAESAGALIREYLDQVLGSWTEAVDYTRFASVKNRLLPVLKPESWVQEIPGGQGMLTVEFAAGLTVCFVIDEPTRMAYVSREMLADWSVPLERVQEVAQDNLAARTSGVQMVVMQGDDGAPRALIVNTQDGYDASRLLLPNVREAFTEELGEQYLVGLPNRDFLIAFSERDEETAAGIIRQVKHDYQRMHHPITATIYRAGPDRIEPTEL